MSPERLSTGSTTSRRKEGPAEGASGRDASSGQQGRTGHTHLWRYSVESRTLRVAEGISPPLFHWWLCGEEPVGILWHQNLVATEDSVQEDQIRHKLSEH